MILMIVVQPVTCLRQALLMPLWCMQPGACHEVGAQLPLVEGVDIGTSQESAVICPDQALCLSASDRVGMLVFLHF